MILTTGVCEWCRGTVRNAPHRRLTMDELTAIHDDTCPGKARGRRKTTNTNQEEEQHG